MDEIDELRYEQLERLGDLMTQKHFIALAKALARALNQTGPFRDGRNVVAVTEYAQWNRDVEAIAKVCLDANPRFDYHRFIEACNK